MCVCMSEISCMCGQSQLGEQAGDSWTGGRGGGGGLVLHGQPWFQLKQGLTLIPAPHTDTHEAERRGRQRLTEDTSATLQVTYQHRSIARSASACRVKVGILISERRVKPQVNIHPWVMAKWITFTTPLYCNLQPPKDYYPANTCAYNLFNHATQPADKANAVRWAVALAIKVI